MLNTRNIHKLDYLMLPLILALAFYVTYIPNLNYPYLVHIDEWVHLAHSKALQQAGSVTFMEAFHGETVFSLSSNLEAGFHLYWSVFQSISGIPWLTLFRYSPSVIFVITVLSVYVMAKREGYGWEAALLTCLIPTTVGVLGPGFMVPVAIGLLFLPLSLFLAFNFRSVWSYLALFLFASFLITIHAPTAIGVVLILLPYIALTLKVNWKHSLGIMLALAIPFLAPFPWIFKLILPTAQSLLTPEPLPTYVDFPMIIKVYGHIPLGLGLLGTLILAIKGGVKNYSLVLGLLALLLMLALYYTLHYGLHILYTRGLMYMMLLLSIVAGAGLMGIRTIKLPISILNNSYSLLVKGLGIALCLVLVGAVLAVAIPERQETPYYHMIDQQDYESFTWIRDNIGPQYKKAILDPWKATAFTAITMKSVYARIHTFPRSSDNKAYKFLRDDCTDTTFLRKNGISIVYAPSECNNPDLMELRKNIYLLKEAPEGK